VKSALRAVIVHSSAPFFFWTMRAPSRDDPVRSVTFSLDSSGLLKSRKADAMMKRIHTYRYFIVNTITNGTPSKASNVPNPGGNIHASRGTVSPGKGPLILLCVMVRICYALGMGKTIYDVRRLAGEKGGEYVLGSADLGTHACYLIYGRISGRESRKISPGAGHEEIICIAAGGALLRNSGEVLTLGEGEAMHLQGEETYYLEPSGTAEVIYFISGGHSGTHHD
jgi:hypothetical protein